MNLFHTFSLPGYDDITVDVMGCDGIQDSDLKRLSLSFLLVWSHVLAEDKTAIANHWKDKAFRDPSGTKRFLNLEVSESNWGNNAHATTESSGTAIRFCWKTCGVVSDKCLHGLIAHEMGHVFQWATGKTRNKISWDDLEGSKDLVDLPLRDHGLVELHADEMAQRWGFDPFLVRAFLRRYFYVRGGEYIRLKRTKNETWASKNAQWDRLCLIVDLEKLGSVGQTKLYVKLFAS